MGNCPAHINRRRCVRSRKNAVRTWSRGGDGASEIAPGGERRSLQRGRGKVREAPDIAPQTWGCYFVIPPILEAYDLLFYGVRDNDCYYAYTKARLDIVDIDYVNLKPGGCFGYSGTAVVNIASDWLESQYSERELYSTSECPEGKCCVEIDHRDGWNPEPLNCAICFGWLLRAEELQRRRRALHDHLQGLARCVPAHMDSQLPDLPANVTWIEGVAADDADSAWVN